MGQGVKNVWLNRRGIGNYRKVGRRASWSQVPNQDVKLKGRDHMDNRLLDRIRSPILYIPSCQRPND